MIVFELREARRNLFFRAGEFVAESLGRDHEIVDHLAAYLSDGCDLAATAARMPDADEEIRDRMGAIDLLEAIGRVAEDSKERARARAVLESMAMRSEDGDSDEPERGIAALALADRADAFTALTRLDQDRGVQLLNSLPLESRRPFRASVAGALLDRGLTRREVRALVGIAEVAE